MRAHQILFLKEAIFLSLYQNLCPTVQQQNLHNTIMVISASPNTKYQVNIFHIPDRII